MKALDTSDEEKKLVFQRDSFEEQLEKFYKRQKNLKIMRMDGEITKTEVVP
ncbi:hypothetical protein [Bacillus sp. OV322]|uniref:hypothetical protein n=1 Tax=Bacillus sp. OV322 TaxID=1882764 RepID=UPI0015A5DA61|nr:hypothetical protein [Bacillus sp. OV322]